jgi:succinate dehydrogenase / fumarate reductase cytochrome b subunit
LRSVSSRLTARVQSLLGVVPLGAFLFLHLYDQLPALQHRELWVDRARHVISHSWAIALVLVPLCLHAVLGGARFVRSRAEAGDALYGPAGLRVIQAVTGALVLGFVTYHVVQLWSVDDGPHQGARAAYALMWQVLGRPLDLAIYLVGISATCFHFAHGVSRAAVTFRLARSPRSLLLFRLSAGFVAFVLWALFLQLLGHFALGAPLVTFG